VAVQLADSHIRLRPNRHCSLRQGRFCCYCTLVLLHPVCYLQPPGRLVIAANHEAPVPFPDRSLQEGARFRCFPALSCQRSASSRIRVPGSSRFGMRVPGLIAFTESMAVYSKVVCALGRAGQCGATAASLARSEEWGRPAFSFPHVRVSSARILTGSRKAGKQLVNRKSFLSVIVGRKTHSDLATSCPERISRVDTRFRE
jgi:hypothetical protein